MNWTDILKGGKKLTMGEQRKVYDAMISGEEMGSHEIAVEAELDPKLAGGITAFLRKCARAKPGNPFFRIFPGIIEISKEERERPKQIGGKDSSLYSNPTIKDRDRARFKREIIEV